MDNKNPGIFIEKVFLLKSSFEMVNPSGEQVYNLHLASYNIKPVEDDSQAGKSLRMYEFSFDIMYKVENPLFNFLCDFAVIYSREDDAIMTWEEFSDSHALAHIIPYLREYVSNMTNRLPVPVLILPPINTASLLKNCGMN